MAKKITIFAEGLLGEKVLEKLKHTNISPAIVTVKPENMRKRQTGNIFSFSDDFNIYETMGEYYEDTKDIIPDSDIFICIDWKKDYFANELPPCPIYYTHPALLPKYKGYGAISEQFARGVIYSGLSIYEYEKDIPVDSGDIIYQEEIKIESYHKPVDFIEACSISIINFIEKINTGEKFTKIKQNEAQGFYLPRVRKNRLIVDFNQSAISVYNFMRAYMAPFSGAVFFHNDKCYNVYDAAIESWSGIEGAPGQVIKKDSYGLLVACGEGSIYIKEILVDNKIIEANTLNIEADDRLK